MAMIMSPKLIGAVIRDRREAMNMSQATLASRIGVDQQMISRIERGGPGSRMIPAEMFNAIADELETTVASILEEAGYEVGTTATPMPAPVGFWAKLPRDAADRLTISQMNALAKVAQELLEAGEKDQAKE